MSHTGLPIDDEEELYASPLLYRLVRTSDGALILEVTVDSVVRVALNEEEIAAYERRGDVALDELAQDIRKNPNYFGRALNLI